MCLAFCLVLGKLRTKVTISSALAGYRGDKTAVFQDQQLPELSISGSAMHVHVIVTLSVKWSQTLIIYCLSPPLAWKAGILSLLLIVVCPITGRMPNILLVIDIQGVRMGHKFEGYFKR